MANTACISLPYVTNPCIGADGRMTLTVLHQTANSMHQVGCEGCRKDGVCKYCFPFDIQPSRKACFNKKTLRWEYFRWATTLCHYATQYAQFSKLGILSRKNMSAYKFAY